MNTKTLHTVSVPGIAASLLMAAIPAWAHCGHDYAYGPRYVQNRLPPKF